MTDRLSHWRSLPDGSLTKAEVNFLIDYIERLERKLLGELATAVSSEPPSASDGTIGPESPR